MTKRLRLFSILAFLLIFALVFSACAPVQRLAATSSEVDWTSLVSVLAYLATGPGAMAAALALGAAGEQYWPAWRDWNPALKNFVVLIIGGVVAFLATLGLQATQLLELMQPWYQVIANVVLSWLGGGLYLYGKRKGGFPAMVGRG